MLKHFGGANPPEGHGAPPAEAPTWFFSNLLAAAAYNLLRVARLRSCDA
jgi:hypothetical protein